MKNIEWFPMSYEENVDLLEKHFNYASTFFKSKNLLLISELLHEEMYKSYSLMLLKKDKKFVLSNHIMDTYLINVRNKKILCVNYFDESKSTYWRKIWINLNILKLCFLF